MATSVSRQAIEPRASRKPDTDVSILLVDDDPGTIQLMGHILAGVGQLRFATNGNDALRLGGRAGPCRSPVACEAHGRRAAPHRYHRRPDGRRKPTSIR